MPTRGGRLHAMNVMAGLALKMGMSREALLDYVQQRYVAAFAGKNGVTRDAAARLAESDFDRMRPHWPMDTRLGQ